MRENIKELVAKYEIEGHMIAYLEIRYEEIVRKFGSVENYIKVLVEEEIAIKERNS